MLGKFENESDLDSLKRIILIREAELKLAEESQKSLFRTPIHLAIGQEAGPVALSRFLKPGDLIYGNHRSHAHYLSLGGDLFKLFTEILGKKMGASGGRGGSMHLVDLENGLMGTMPIVAGTIPVAAGSALALKHKAGQNLAVSFFGDGATEEGVFHETLNFSSQYQLPILFFCENNSMSSHLHIDLRQPNRRLSRFADANQVESRTLDGSDFESLLKDLDEVVEYIRHERKPFFIEIKTYRYFGHVGGERDEEVGLNRKSDLDHWMAKDVVDSLIKKTQKSGLKESDLLDIHNSIKEYVNQIWNEALEASNQHDETVLSRVYFGVEN